jgi:cell division protein FtsL
LSGGQVVGAEARGRRPGAGVFCLVLLGLTLGALGHVAVQAKKDELALLLGKERADHEALLIERRQLKIEIGRLKDPARLVKLAEGTLGMALVDSTSIRVVRPADLAGSAARTGTAPAEDRRRPRKPGAGP